MTSQYAFSFTAPLMVSLGIHQLLFVDFYASLYRRWGRAATGWMTPTGEAMFYGAVSLLAGAVLILIGREWGSLSVAIVGSIVLASLKYLAPEAWRKVLPLGTLIPIVAGLLVALATR
ncbi:MAG: hypothetical protein ACM3XZ_08500 [Betaproteobacteria bacterium]